jgi:hypothetical protein
MDEKLKRRVGEFPYAGMAKSTFKLHREEIIHSIKLRYVQIKKSLDTCLIVLHNSYCIEHRMSYDRQPLDVCSCYSVITTVVIRVTP